MYPRPINSSKVTFICMHHLFDYGMWYLSHFSEIGEYFMWVEMKQAEFWNNIDIFAGQFVWQFPMPSNRDISGGRTYIDDVLIGLQSFSYLFRWWPELVLARRARESAHTQ